jgi:hypothetical protein
MAQSARVTAIQALVDFKAKLCRFGIEANNALAGLDMQIRRIFEWLEEQTDYWRGEIRRCQELVTRAKNQLYQRKAMGTTHGRGPGYTEQEVALEEAQERLREAETKLENCRYWTVNFPREVTECEGPARQLTSMLESDLRRAVAHLDQKILALEAYVQLTSGGADVPDTAPPAKAGGQGLAGAGAKEGKPADAAPPQTPQPGEKVV